LVPAVDDPVNGLTATRVVVAEAERLQKMIAAARATRLLADPGKA
jgi:hypothetical protein